MTDTLSNPSQEFQEQLLQSYPVVYGRVAAQFRDPQLAEEVASDCLTSAWQKWTEDPGYFTTHDLVAWTSRRAQWKAVDELRQRARVRPLPEEHPEGSFDEGGGFRGAPAIRPRVVNDTEEQVRAKQVLLASLDHLPPLEREVVVAHHFHGETDQQVGTRLFADGTAQARGLRVWRLRQRAYERLRDLLAAAGVGPEDGGPYGMAV